MATLERFVQDFEIARFRHPLAAIDTKSGVGLIACPTTMQLACDAAPLRRHCFGSVAHLRARWRGAHLTSIKLRSSGAADVGLHEFV
jgi:hypothetical protein